MNNFFTKKTLIENKANITLVFCFDNDLDATEKTFVINLFRETGYIKTNEICFNDYLAKKLQNRIMQQSVPIMLSSINGDIYIKNLYDKTNRGDKIIKGIGIDPQYNTLANLIYNQIIAVNQFVKKEGINSFLLSEAETALQSNNNPLMGNVRVSEYECHEYCVYRREINNIIKYSNIGTLLNSAVDDMLEDFNISKNNACLLLNDYNMNTDYFYNFLCKNFGSIIRIDEKIREETFNLILEEVIKNDYYNATKYVSQAPTSNREDSDFPTLPQPNTQAAKAKPELPPLPPQTKQVAKAKPELPPLPPQTKQAAKAKPIAPPPPPQIKQAEKAKPVVPPPPPKK